MQGQTLSVPIRELFPLETVTVRAGDSLKHASNTMRKNGTDGLVVVEQEGLGYKPIGLLEARDLITEILALGIEPGSVTVGDLMTHAPITAREDVSLSDILTLMSSSGFRRIPIIDCAGFIKGCITFVDILAFVHTEMGQLVDLLNTEKWRFLRLDAPGKLHVMASGNTLPGMSRCPPVLTSLSNH